MLDPYDNYYLVKARMRELTEEKRYYQPSGPNNPFWPWIILLFFIAMCFLSADTFAAMPRLPGTDQSDKLQAAGSLLRLIDVAVFSWGARIFAGLLVVNAGVCLKNQAFGLAIICIIGAILIGTAPIWVKNIFDMGGGTLFSAILSIGGVYV